MHVPCVASRGEVCLSVWNRNAISTNNKNIFLLDVINFICLGRAGRRSQWGVWYFDHAWSAAWSASALGFARFSPLTSDFLLEVATKKSPALVVLPASSAERTAREEKGADHRPRSRQWPVYARRGTGGASTCTNGPNYGLRPCDRETGPNGPRVRFHAVASSRRPRHRPRDF